MTVLSTKRFVSMTALLTLASSHFVRCSLPLLLACILPGFARADDSWVGKTILLKKSGIRITHTDKDGHEVDDATLTDSSYKVLAEQGQRLKVRHNGERAGSIEPMRSCWRMPSISSRSASSPIQRIQELMLAVPTLGV